MDASAQVLQIYKVMCGVCDAGGDRQLAQKLLILSFLQHQASDVKGGHAIQEKRDVCLTFTCNKTILTVRLSAACGTPTPNRPMPVYSAQLLRRHYCPSSLLARICPKHSSDTKTLAPIMPSLPCQHHIQDMHGRIHYGRQGPSLSTRRVGLCAILE